MYKPYIGITGFVKPSETAAVLDSLPGDSHRLLMIGVLASSRTLRGREARWPNRYPGVRGIAAVLPRHPSTLNLVHYNTEEPESLSQQLLELTQLGGPDLHGFQLNVAWPPVTELAGYRRRYPQMKMVLQINRESLEFVGNSAGNLADRLGREYAGLADYLLLDPSAGYGVPLDPFWAAQYLAALEEAGLNMGLGVAGGLSASTLDQVAPLILDFPDLSIDAESRLRDKDDHLDVSAARRYLDRAWQLFARAGDPT